ncbi:hypothetical protein NLD30_01575 [SCandidatus Aminicenantes bacterium Aminicenantia_JdfR_composite]|jgi:hypothetical protein|nr:hypothetical protein [SCandidatus Aminicenantes bacterium Aminicenantia_JdfR_composite]MCP2596278.1 hypothetical protein [Candidatus Aminicenantes bacterium AC-335-G13]MCP2597853.1 hypothetical protein [Candidatus Aminicenantes bacterium AC-335-L06]MCP2605608.1 hypothetical protein [Candidatus Aminicenantes bacterium AC-335-O07]MCP2620490.1 hypothetical protein [Candidatus Aminicenantes bacterium AC-334-E05]
MGIVFLFLISTLNYANQKNKTQANIEIGIDSFERRYYKPELKFYFSFNSLGLLIGAKYYQRNNSKLIGEIDYWLNGSLFYKIKENLRIETGLYHMCRHLTSQENYKIFDLNEVIAKIWTDFNKNSIALGIGTYIGENSYRNLLILNTHFDKIFESEFSIYSEFKFVNFKKILYEVEFSLGLNKSFDLFLRNTKTYRYPSMTYIGLRIKSDGKVENYINKIKLGIGIYPFYENYKLGIENEFRIDFFKTSMRRIIVQASSLTPILRGEKFFGTFWPEKMAYPLQVEYERKINEQSVYLFGYCNYTIELPLDVSERFRSSLGIGMGLRNQQDFEILQNKMRYEISGGCNFRNDFDLNFRFGVNTLKKNTNMGTEVTFKLDSKKSFIGLKVFLDFGKELELRPFFKFENLSHLKNSGSQNKFSIGIEFIKWYF